MLASLIFSLIFFIDHDPMHLSTIFSWYLTWGKHMWPKDIKNQTLIWSIVSLCIRWIQLCNYQRTKFLGQFRSSEWTTEVYLRSLSHALKCEIMLRWKSQLWASISQNPNLVHLMNLRLDELEMMQSCTWYFDEGKLLIFMNEWETWDVEDHTNPWLFNSLNILR